MLKNFIVLYQTYDPKIKSWVHSFEFFDFLSEVSRFLYSDRDFLIIAVLYSNDGINFTTINF